MAVGRVDVLEGDDVVPCEEPRLGIEGREPGPGRTDLRLPLGTPGDAPADTGAAGGRGDGDSSCGNVME